MGVHHLAFASRDTRATHEFYTEAMGFRLAKVEVGATPSGWAKHFFYEIREGGAMIAFWELHDDSIPAGHPTAISKGLGLPAWVNHVAFAAETRADLDGHRERWLAHGHDVMEIDHGWCTSIYALDPNEILVEFCLTTRALDAADRAEAARLLFEPTPPVAAAGKAPVVHRAAEARSPAA
jgi:catechol 2,3-dioxygenase-like lactoylglutathione lyase family enzyme